MAFAALAFVVHDVSLAGLIAAFTRVHLSIFLPACIFSILCWLIGETLLFARLFSYFHGRTTFREMLPADAMQEFLQIIDMIVASTAIVAFVNRRKNVPFLAAGSTILLLGLVDLQVIAGMALFAAPWATGLPVHIPWRYPAAIIAATWAFALFWMYLPARSKLGRWVEDRPSLHAFRTAQPLHYLKLSAIRAVIFAAQSLVLYLQLLSFDVHAPHENLMDMNHQFLHQRLVGRIRPQLVGCRKGEDWVEASYRFERLGGRRPFGARLLMKGGFDEAARADGEAAEARNDMLMAIKTCYPCQTLEVFCPRSETAAYGVWAVYVPLDREQRRHRSFGMLIIRKPQPAWLLHLAWPVIRAFTELIFRQDRRMVEAEQQALEQQGGDRNREIYTPILPLREVLTSCGAPVSQRHACLSGSA